MPSSSISVSATTFLRPLPKTAGTSRFSLTVRVTKGWGIWYVLPMPSRHILCAGSPVMSCPLNLTLPASGAYSPAMTLRRVVLPAPFGPMRPTTAPLSTPKVTLL